MNASYASGRHSSLEEISRALGLTRERVCRIEAAAMRKCRRWAVRNGYAIEDLIGEPMNGESSLSDTAACIRTISVE